MSTVARKLAERYRDRAAHVPAVAVALCAYALLAAALIAAGLTLMENSWLREPVSGFDRDITGWLDRHQHPVLTTLLHASSTLVDTWTVVGVMIGCLTTLVVTRQRHAATLMVVGPAVELAVFLTVTFVVARPRPDVALGAVPSTGSFPSGHAAMSVALYGGLAMAIRYIDDREKVRRLAAGVAVLVIAAVGASRLYLGVHYFTDVVAGYALGACSLAAGLLAARAVTLHSARETLHPTPRNHLSTPRSVLAGVLVLGFAVTVWGVIVEPRVLLAVQREDAVLPELPDAWDSARIGVITDLQIGMWLDNVGMVREAVAELVAADPAAVLILGDFVYGEADTEDDVDLAVESVRPLTAAGIPTFAVLGNHDHAAGAAPQLTRRLEDLGVEVLSDESAVLTRGGDDLHVVGISPVIAGADPEAALDDVPADAPRVVMMHNPSTFDRLSRGTAPLAVAGHTHGGQVRVPFLPEWSYLELMQDDPVAVDGWIDGFGTAGNRLFVNRGIGMSVVPVRLNCTPAITVFTLRQPDRGNA